ncbi:MAG TPA: hypothetical protein VJQ84_08090 [Solirubrobacterales bacterium]|nr:hypothetical protein [Solirubrobacterales bacterium]
MSLIARGSKIAACSLMAIIALACIQASTARAGLTVGGKTLEANETLTSTAVTEYLVNVPKKNMIIHCKKIVKFWEWLFFGFIPYFHHVEELRECVTLGGGKEVVNCKPIEPIVFKSVGLLILHNSKTYILFEPESGKKMGTIELGELCALAETSDVTGSFVVECLTSGGASGNCSEEMATHKMRSASAALFSADSLNFGSNQMTFEGTEAVTLSGVNAGNAWGASV